MEETNLETLTAESIPNHLCETGTERLTYTGEIEIVPVRTNETTTGTEQDNSDTEDNESESETQPTVRRSTRQRAKTRTLTYPELGNPLVTVVQSLFKSLSSAITESLDKPDFTRLPEPEIV